MAIHGLYCGISSLKVYRILKMLRSCQKYRVVWVVVLLLLLNEYYRCCCMIVWVWVSLVIVNSVLCRSCAVEFPRILTYNRLRLEAYCWSSSQSSSAAEEHVVEVWLDWTRRVYFNILTFFLLFIRNFMLVVVDVIIFSNFISLLPQLFATGTYTHTSHQPIGLTSEWQQSAQQPKHPTVISKPSDKLLLCLVWI